MAMYRSDKGSLRWSWSRLVSNAVPNFANDDPLRNELTLAEQDRLFDWQISQPAPKALNPASYRMAGITTSQAVGGRIHKALLKAGILLPDSPTIRTENITPKFANQQATISVHAQRKLVNMLFEWEEELMRWRLLEEEEEEIRTVVDGERRSGGSVGELEVRLKEIEGLKGLKPSLRSAESRAAETLPSYGEARAM
jgi:hypothetical protein